MKSEFKKNFVDKTKEGGGRQDLDEKLKKDLRSQHFRYGNAGLDY